MMQLCEKKELLNWLCCPRCGGKTRMQVRSHTVLENFPLFCPKYKYTCVIYFQNGKMEETKMPDAKTQCRPRKSVCAAFVVLCRK